MWRWLSRISAGLSIGIFVLLLGLGILLLIGGAVFMLLWFAG